MPKLGFKFSEISKQKMRDSHKGKIAWNKGLTGFISPMQGKKHSLETKLKMSLKAKGRKSWNKGKKGIYSAETLRKISESGKGRPAWNKGKSTSMETRNRIGIANKGKFRSLETKLKMSESHKGEKCHFWKGGLDLIPGRKTWIKNKRNHLKRLRNLNGSLHTFGEWENLKAQYNWTCPSCHKQEPLIKLTEDHIIPLSKGGGDNIENIQPLCGSCNCKKHDKVVYY